MTQPKIPITTITIQTNLAPTIAVSVGMGIAWLAAVGITAFWANCAFAQITPDTTLPNNSTIKPEGKTTIIIEGGTKVGGNLFHSFSEFSIPTHGTAIFNNALDIQNIISRVTGRAVSKIDGLIQTNGMANRANLFLLNPNGIIFGPNASLNVGSFLATTVDAIVFPNGAQFSATNPGEPSSLLTIVGDPSGFLASQRQPGSIQTFGSFLAVQGRQSLVLLGGNLSFDSEGSSPDGTSSILGIADTHEGQVELGSIAGAGIVQLSRMPTPDANLLSLSFPDQLARGDVSFRHGSTINVLAESGGNISIYARDIRILEGSQLLAGIGGGLNGTQAGDIRLNATGAITLSGQSSHGERSRLFNTVSSKDSVGNAGNILITARSLSVTDSGEINTSTFGQGNGGNIAIAAPTVFLDTGFQGGGIFSDASPAVSGEGGSIFIKTNTLSLTNGSTLNVAATGQGNAGNIFIDTRSLSVTGGAKIAANTTNGLNAGNVVINARDTVKVDGFGVDQNGQVIVRPDNKEEPVLSQIISGVDSGSGQGGDIRITTGSLFVTNGGQLTANTFGQGNAGNIIVNARDFISLSGRLNQGSFDEPSGLLARTTNSGKGGSIILQPQAVNQLLSVFVQDGATISVNSQGSGTGGKINITTKLLSITNSAELATSSIGQGNAGDIEVNSPQITLDNQGKLNAQSASGNGGDIKLQTDLLLLRRGAEISTTAGTAEAGGDGGNINIDAPSGFIIAVPRENSDITANAFNGQGGKVTINAIKIFGLKPLSRQQLEQLLRPTEPEKLDPKNLPTSDITAISQINPNLNGQVVFNTLDVDPSRGLVQLPTNLVDASQKIDTGCNVGGKQRKSSFVITGRGGLPPQPGEALRTEAIIVNGVAAEQNPSASGNFTPDSNSRIVEAQGWVVNSLGEITLTAYPTSVTPSQNFRSTPATCHAS